MYCEEGVKKPEQNINDLMKEEEEIGTIIRGNWNARIEKKSEMYLGEEEEEVERNSNNKTTTAEGEPMPKIMEEKWVAYFKLPNITQ